LVGVGASLASVVAGPTGRVSAIVVVTIRAGTHGSWCCSEPSRRTGQTLTGIRARKTPIITSQTFLVHAIIVVPHIANTILIDTIESSLPGSVASLALVAHQTAIASILTLNTCYGSVVVVVSLSAGAPPRLE
jgi:hypothetical protein